MSSLPASPARGDGFLGPVPSSLPAALEGVQPPPISADLEAEQTVQSSMLGSDNPPFAHLPGPSKQPLIYPTTQQPIEGSTSNNTSKEFAEAVFFSYGVVVFFGLEEGQERGILEDVEAAGAMRHKMDEDKWEIEECHYAASIFCPPSLFPATKKILIVT